MLNNAVKILVLDDEPAIVEPLKTIFTIMGFEVFGVMNGNEAISLFSQEKIGICILDINLKDPNIDGLGVLEAIKKIDNEAICIMFTQSSEPEAVARASELGVYEYLNKPLDPIVLKRIVKEAAEIIGQRSSAHG